MEQMNIFDFLDEVEEWHKCTDCVHAKFKEQMRDGNPLYYCNEARSYITIHSYDWICKKHGERSKFERGYEH